MTSSSIRSARPSARVSSRVCCTCCAAVETNSRAPAVAIALGDSGRSAPALGFPGGTAPPGVAEVCKSNTAFLL